MNFEPNTYRKLTTNYQKVLCAIRVQFKNELIIYCFASIFQSVNETPTIQPTECKLHRLSESDSSHRSDRSKVDWALFLIWIDDSKYILCFNSVKRFYVFFNYLFTTDEKIISLQSSRPSLVLRFNC